MEISVLKIFSEVMHQRSFAHVARAHGIAPSSVSRCIAGLEKELGIRLFQRSTRKLEPTEAGLSYFERISPLIEELENAHLAASDLIKEARGTLRVTAPTVFAQLHLVPLLPSLAAKYPNLSVELLLSDAYLDLIEERVDIAIRLGTPTDSTYIVRHLAQQRFYICASPSYIEKNGSPKTPEQIRDHQCLLFPRAGHNLNWLFKDKTGSISEIPISGNFMITNSLAIKQCVVAGMGICLLPDWLVKEDLGSASLIRLFPDYEVTATDFDNSVWLLFPSRDYLPAKVRLFIEFLQDNLFQSASEHRSPSPS